MTFPSNIWCTGVYLSMGVWEYGSMGGSGERWNGLCIPDETQLSSRIVQNTQYPNTQIPSTKHPHTPTLPHSHTPILILFLIALCFIGCASPDPNDPEVAASITESRNLGLAYLEENQLNEAEEEFSKIVELNPEDVSGHANLGVVFLRRGNFDEAEASLTRALAITPDDPSIYLSLAETYVQMERPNRAREVIDQAFDRTPDHVPTLYKRAQLNVGTENAASFMGDVVAQAPANIVPRLYYIEALIDAGDAGVALEQLAEARQQLPELPRETEPHLEEALIALQNADLESASRSARIFHNLLKVTPYYQTGLRLLGIRTDALAGIPVISEPTGLTQSAFFQEGENADIIDQIRFTDATDNAQLAGLANANNSVTALALADINSDGETDVFAATWNAETRTGTLHLLENQFGRFVEYTGASGLVATDSPTRFALFGDYDNDTFLDLFLINDNGSQLYHNLGDGTFEDVSANAGIDVPAGNKAAFADLDHDGDLDLVVAGKGQNRVYRNNMDGTFAEMAAAMNLAGSDSPTYDIDFGDFDDDGDLDLLMTGERGAHLYSNERQGRLDDATADAGLPETPATSSVVSDFNNDGFLDLAVSASNGLHFYANQGGLMYEQTSFQEAPPAADGQFVDIDNDGLLDFVLAGNPLQVFRNEGNGELVDISTQLFQEASGNVSSLAVTDYNLDRDLDLFVIADGDIRLLRNDGGHMNRSISVQTRGLLTNNSKNNYYSIGAKVEVRAGDLYQMRVVTSPVTHFGIGKRLKADVVRIVFTNGVPQNIFRPGSDQDIIEQQILKGSCPFLYTWNGTEYTFATDILWRSALGMPLGILGGETAYAPATPAMDYIKIPDGLLVETDGQYRMQITGELWETPFFDEVKLIVVDHPDTLSLWVDERFGPPQPDPMYFISQTTAPRSAVDEKGRDLLPALAARDSVYTGPLTLTPYQGITESHDLILDPGKDIDPENAVLYLQGWIFPTDASINVALSQSDRFIPMPPQVQVKDKAGQWQTVIDNAGFPMGKNKAVRIDLSGLFLSEELQVRIRTNMQIYWDHAFFTDDEPVAATNKTQYRIRRTQPVSAELYYRGFSRMYRTSPFGPHLFDFADVDTSQRWRDLEGRYTRFGNVKPLLESSDDQYVILNAGDAMEVAFNAKNLPVLPANWTRSFVLYSNGWLKDGDLNTAFGKSVEPLPFLGMSAYPYAHDETYPMNAANSGYIQKYNTRIVSHEAFRQQVKH